MLIKSNFLVKKLSAGLVSVSALTLLSVTSPETIHAQDATSETTQNNVHYGPEVIGLIRNTRQRMYDDPSITFNGVPLAEYVASFGLSRDQYINGVAYDTNNEASAHRRAAETAQHGKMWHYGPDGNSAPSYAGDKASSENLAWANSLTPGSSFNLWVDREIADLKAANGHFNGNNGHLHAILNPANLSFGYGQAQGGPYGAVSALTISNLVGDIDYDFGKVAPGEVPTVQPSQPEIEEQVQETETNVQETTNQTANGEELTAEPNGEESNEEIQIENDQNNEESGLQIAPLEELEVQKSSSNETQATEKSTENTADDQSEEQKEQEVQKSEKDMELDNQTSTVDPSENTQENDANEPSANNEKVTETDKISEINENKETPVKIKDNENKNNKTSDEPSLNDLQEAKVIFNLGNGETFVKEAKIGDVITIPNAPEKPGYKFLYWKGSRYYPGDSFKVTEASKTLTAVYEKVALNDEVVEVKDTKETKGQKAKQEQLPETGLESSSLLFNGAALSILTGLGMVTISKRKEN